MNTTYEYGNKLLHELYEEGISGVLNNLCDISPHIGRYITETFGRSFSNSILTYQQRELITIAVLTSLGDCPNQLNWHIHFGLSVGLSPNEIIEIFTHCIPFCGFPRALNTIAVAKQIFAEQSIQIQVEDELAHTSEKRATGLVKLREIDGQHGEEVIDSLTTIAPGLGEQIIEFTFGEIYNRSPLNMKQRQLVTLGALTGLGGCEPQLHVHLHAAIRVGLSRQEIIEALLQCSAYAGYPKVLNAVSVARQIFQADEMTKTE